eukprot:9559398-Lingulodinium_polyedra.AAC.1
MTQTRLHGRRVAKQSEIRSSTRNAAGHDQRLARSTDSAIALGWAHSLPPEQDGPAPGPGHLH